MAISEMLRPEFEHEMANTRKTLERVPEDKFDWKPHEKSMSLGGLSTHLANIPSWTEFTFSKDELDIAPVGGEPFRLDEARSRDALLEAFDKNVAAARTALTSASDEDWQGKWSLLRRGKPDFHSAARGGDARFRNESFDSSSGPARGVSAFT